MSTLYWITVLGNLNILLGILLIISSCIVFVGTLIIMVDGDNLREGIHRTIKFRNCGFKILIPSLIGIVFIPSDNQLYMIYGVGGTIDYLKENPTAKELPDKCIKALDTWVDNFNKESNND